MFARIFQNFALNQVYVSLRAIISYFVIQLVLTLGFDGSVYRFVLPRRKALTCRFPVLAAKYRLSVYGSDFPEDRLYEEGSDGSDVAFALAGSREAFINVGLKTDAAADILTFRTILADIERSMYDE